MKTLTLSEALSQAVALAHSHGKTALAAAWQEAINDHLNEQMKAERARQQIRELSSKKRGVQA